MSRALTGHRSRRLMAPLLILGVMLAGCTPGSTPISEPTSPPPLSTPAPSGCLSEMAGYPDAPADPARSAAIPSTVRSLGGSDRDWSSAWTPTAADVHTTTDAPDKVFAYVVGTMKALGWTNTRHSPGRNGGFERWSKGGSDAQILVGSNDGRTVIVRGCRIAPTPNVTSTPATPH